MTSQTPSEARTSERQESGSKTLPIGSDYPERVLLKMEMHVDDSPDCKCFNKTEYFLIIRRHLSGGKIREQKWGLGHHSSYRPKYYVHWVEFNQQRYGLGRGAAGSKIDFIFAYHTKKGLMVCFSKTYKLVVETYGGEPENHGYHLQN